MKAKNLSEICNSFQKGKCTSGDSCLYFHPQIVCKHALKGSCPKGRKCLFSHNPEELQLAATPYGISLKRDPFCTASQQELDRQKTINSSEKTLPAAPGSLQKFCCRVFWDCTHVQVYLPYKNVTLQDNLDVIYNVFVKQLLVDASSFKIWAVLSKLGQKYLSKTLTKDFPRSEEWVETYLAKGQDGTCISSVRESNEYLKARIKKYLEEIRNSEVTNPESCILVLISGSKVYMAELEEARCLGVKTVVIGKKKHRKIAKEIWNARWINSVLDWNLFMRTHMQEKPTSPKKDPPTPGERPIGTSIDLLLLMDATHSMTDAMAAVKDKLCNEFVDGLIGRWPSLRDRIRYAVVAYRDHPDTYMKHNKGIADGDIPKQFEVLPWTPDPEAVQGFLRELKTTDYQQDIAEDIAGGLMKAAELKWRDEGIRILFHVLDAPSHGAAFQQEGKKYDYFDSPPAGRDDPETEIRSALTHLITLARVDRYFMCHVRRNGKDRTKATSEKFHEIVNDVFQRYRTGDGHNGSAAPVPDAGDTWLHDIDLGDSALGLVWNMLECSSGIIAAMPGTPPAA